jgi:L-alanine-DL-glutamate epimerase-like enolase superfamily enzyme
MKGFDAMLTRRDWLRVSAVGAVAGTFACRGAAAENVPARPDYEQTLFDLPGQINEPVIIESIELLRRDRTHFLRTRAKNGAVGLTPTKQVQHFVPIFEHMVAPHFIGKDARDLESLIDAVHVANYKDVGLPFWCPVAYCEQSALDLLGKVAGKPVGALLGGVLRTRVPVYLSGSARQLTAEDEVDVYVRGVAETGARAVKFKIGGRMSRNADVYPGRTETLLRLSRERLGDDVTLYADANGSYDARKGIEVGRRLEDLNYAFYEEPCPFEELSLTQAVASALTMTVAGGEQDSSLWRFQWMLDNGVVTIVQPDLNYHGGFIRTARVARMAAAAGKTIVPHNTQTGVASANILQFASCTPNIGPFMEYPYRRPHEPASWYSPNFPIRDGELMVPDGPGFGVEIDPGYLAGATTLASVS